jgi:hypothetical protein
VTLLVVLQPQAPGLVAAGHRHATFSTAIANRQTTSAGLAVRQTISVEK